jgi:hypothetical protein
LPEIGKTQKPVRRIIAKENFMFSNLKKIFGYPRELSTSFEKNGKSAETSKTTETAGIYLPASQIPEGGIEGVAGDGSTWQEWRIDSQTGEQWYQRTSRTANPVDARPDIHGIAPADDNDEDVHIRSSQEVLDILDEQHRLSAEMFEKHKLRARERAMDNSFGIPDEYEPDESDEDDDFDE